MARLSLLLALFASLSLVAQEESERVFPELSANKWVGDFKHDGELNEAFWNQCNIATDFITREPTPNLPASQRTEVMVAYDDQFLYVGARLFDSAPDSILHQLTERDDLGNTDWFGVSISPYQDGINGFEFFVTPEGVLVDSRVTADSEDWGWDAVWMAKANIDDKGWTAEYRIPFSALRFPQSEEQNWDVQFTRSIRRTREVSSWSFVDPMVAGFFNQAGKLDGIIGIETPIRLFFYPYVSAGTSASRFEVDEGEFSSESSFTYAGGMDVKYGLNDAFTLDMTLVPDFSQVQTDQQVLNVTPFEVRFQENRAFFTEGTELFNKGGIFYSRRIGGFPVFLGNLFNDLQEGDSLIDVPSVTQLINATKVSGRTEKGLGIGVFNAVTSETVGRYQSAADGDIKETIIDPLTNFNVVVFDQNLKNNSYASIINTNVLRQGEFYDANVTATEFELRNKANSYSISGDGAFTYRPNAGDGEEQGHAFGLSAGKIDGNFNWEVFYGQESDTYNPNDLGFLFNNNSHEFGAYMGYFIYEPFGKFNRLWSNLNIGRSHLYSTGAFMSNNLNFNGGMATRNFFAFGTNVFASLGKQNDWFEAREDGRLYVLPNQIYSNVWFSSDYRKAFALDGNIGYSNFSGQDRPRFEWSIAPRVRVNDKLNFNYRLYNFYAWRDEGWADHLDEDEIILFGVRDRIVYNQSLNVNYVFTPFMSTFARVRHFWSGVDVKEVRSLADDGSLKPLDPAMGYNFADDAYDRNFDGFTADIGFRWIFTPGSEFSVVYRMINDDIDNQVTSGLFQSVEDSFAGSRQQVFTVRLLYFLDALQFKRKAVTINRN